MKDLQKLNFPESKRDIMKTRGGLGFYSCYIKNHHVDNQPLFELIKDTTLFKWTDQHESVLKEIKFRINEDTILAVPLTEYPFHLHGDSSNVATGCILVHESPDGKRKVSFNSRLFDNAEQTMSTLHCELCGVISALQTYEQYFFGSNFPICLYCDQKPFVYFRNQRRHIVFSTIKSSTPKFTAPNSYGHLDLYSHFLTFSAGKWHSQRQIDYNFNMNSFRTIYHSRIRTSIRCTTQPSMKMNMRHRTMTSSPSYANKVYTRKVLRLKNDEIGHHVEQYHEKWTTSSALYQLRHHTQRLRFLETLSQLTDWKIQLW